MPLALKEISYDSTNKISIAALGAIPLLIKNAAKANNDVKTKNALALIQLCEKNVQNAYDAIQCGAVGPMADLLQGKGITGDAQRTEAVMVAVKGLVIMSSPPSGHCGRASLPELAENKGLILQLVRCLRNAPADETKHNAVKLLCNLCNEETGQEMLLAPMPGEGFLQVLLWLLKEGPPDCLAKACECFYLLCKKPERREAIEESNAADPLTNIKDKSRDLEAKHFATEAMALLDDV